MEICVKCNSNATVKFGNDPDLKGVWSCEDCKEKVRLALIVSINNGQDFEKTLKRLR